MKKSLIPALAAALVCLVSCQKPQFVKPNAVRQGLTSLSAIITSGEFKDMVMTTFYVDSVSYKEGYFTIPIPWFFPETSESGTTFHMASMRLQAELQPDYVISPKLGTVNLLEENWYTLTDPEGNSRRICITGQRTKSSKASIVSFLISDMMLSCIVYEEEHKLLVPYLGDLSSVSVSAQVSPHATLSKISGKEYKEDGKFSLNAGGTVAVKAHDGTEVIYKVEQGMPDKIDYGFNEASVAELFALDAAKMAGLPPYTEPAFVSIAAIENTLVVCTGEGSFRCVNGFTGASVSKTVNVAGTNPSVITADEAEHLLLASFADRDPSTAADSILTIWKKSSLVDTPVELCHFLIPTDVPVGHRMKVIGDVTKDAVIVLTAEGIPEVTTTAKAVVVSVKNGAVVETDGKVASVVDFYPKVGGWSAAPVHIATVVAASLTPEDDGWYLDYYEGNADADGNYLLHWFDGSLREKTVARIGNGNNNPNCLDSKQFNGAKYMTLFVVSHFPQWTVRPMLYLYEIGSPDKPRLLFSNEEVKMFNTGDMADNGASGDVALCPSADGYRLYLYYYDHHSQVVGGYVVDCIKK